MAIFYIMIILFVLGYLCIALEHPLKVNKAAFALLLGVSMWVLYVIAGEGIFDVTNFGAGFEAFKAEHPASAHPFIDFITTHELIEHLGDIAEILFYLMGAMTVVELIDTYQGFSIITDHIKTTNKVKLLWILGFITFFFSAILDNLTTAIVMVALLRKLLPDQHDRWFFGGVVILAANAGGAWSPIGDVTTIMLWVAGKVSTGAVMLHAFIPSLVSMIIPLIVISFFEKGEIDASQLHRHHGFVLAGRQLGEQPEAVRTAFPVRFPALSGLPQTEGGLAQEEPGHPAFPGQQLPESQARTHPLPPPLRRRELVHAGRARP